MTEWKPCPVCSKFLELTEPSECRYYEPIKEVSQ